mmetsp:Transcript_19878/g.59190  ORF Transcript_19878/g.59190 Transcript_19878/m.59190 type:complete len:226 (+) Transcript_19878:42-719(+)
MRATAVTCVALRWYLLHVHTDPEVVRDEEAPRGGRGAQELGGRDPEALRHDAVVADPLLLVVHEPVDRAVHGVSQLGAAGRGPRVRVLRQHFAEDRVLEHVAAAPRVPPLGPRAPVVEVEVAEDARRAEAPQALRDGHQLVSARALRVQALEVHRGDGGARPELGDDGRAAHGRRQSELAEVGPQRVPHEQQAAVAVDGVRADRVALVEALVRPQRRRDVVRDLL